MVRGEEPPTEVFHECPRPDPLTGSDEGENLRGLGLCLGCDGAVRPSGVHLLAGVDRSVRGS
jgi:hypothetical protein